MWVGGHRKQVQKFFVCLNKEGNQRRLGNQFFILDVLLITHVDDGHRKQVQKFFVCLNKEGNQHRLGNQFVILDVLLITHVGVMENKCSRF